MAYTNPSVADFQAFFNRDFPYGTDINTSVVDGDITKAFTMANNYINPALFPDQSSYNTGYFYLSAHFMVLNLRMSSQGINGQYNFLQSSKSVGSASESFSIPQEILDNPLFSMLVKTNYGSMYLELILPQLIGQIYCVVGSTRP